MSYFNGVCCLWYYSLSVDCWVLARTVYLRPCTWYTLLDAHIHRAILSFRIRPEIYSELSHGSNYLFILFFWRNRCNIRVYISKRASCLSSWKVGKKYKTFITIITLWLITDYTVENYFRHVIFDSIIRFSYTWSFVAHITVNSSQYEVLKNFIDTEWKWSAFIFGCWFWIGYSYNKWFFVLFTIKKHISLTWSVNRIINHLSV